VSEQEARIRELSLVFEGNRDKAYAYVEFEGRCAFCGRDLIGTPDAYSIGTLDHILPKGKYPELSEDQRNKALSCLVCNHLKGNFDPLKHDEDPLEMVREGKRALISRSTAAIREQEQRANENWKKAKAIVLEGTGKVH